MWTDETFKVTRHFFERAKTSDIGITKLAAGAGMSQPQLSTYLHGGTFGPAVREKILAAGAVVDVAMAAVPEYLGAEEECIAEKYAALGATQVFDWSLGRCYVGLATTGDLLTFPGFVSRFGDEGRRWLDLPIAAKKVCGSPMEWRAAHPSMGPRS